MKKYYDAVIVGCGVAGCFAALHLPQEADILIDGVGRALVPGAALAAHVGRQDMHAAGGAVQIPGLAAADVAVEFQGAVLGQHAHGVDAGVDTVGQGEIDDAVFSPKRYSRFCQPLGQGIKP